jgi:hypothetical protein
MKARYTKLFCLIAGAFYQSIASAQHRFFTVQDAVEMAYFGNIFNSSPEESHDDDGAVSPDGRFAIKITHRCCFPISSSGPTLNLCYWRSGEVTESALSQ